VIDAAQSRDQVSGAITCPGKHRSCNGHCSLIPNSTCRTR
jgi:hypothetical protein